MSMCCVETIVHVRSEVIIEMNVLLDLIAKKLSLKEYLLLLVHAKKRKRYSANKNETRLQ